MLRPILSPLNNNYRWSILRLPSSSTTKLWFSSASSPPSPLLTISHLDPESGEARMVGVGDKQPSQERVALASGVVQFPQGMLSLIMEGKAAMREKGDIFAVSRVAGISAAKLVPQLIPLCHQIPLTSVRIQFRVDTQADRIHVFCRAKAVQCRTGVEMEAMTGCTLAALTLYDMTKSASLGIRLESVHLLGKRGGRRDFGQTELEELDSEINNRERT